MVEALYLHLNPSLLAHFNEVAQWMGLPSLSTPNQETLSNRYHFHIRAAQLSLKEHRLLPKVVTGDGSSPQAPPLPLTIYLDEIRSAHNVGSIFRTTEALQLGSICCSPNTPSPRQKQVQDTAMGAEKWVEWSKSSLTDPLPRPWIALETVEGATSLYQWHPPTSPFTLILGNEEYGCSQYSLQEADLCLQIPLLGRKNSLNVANAFAMAASHIHHILRPLF